MEICDRCKEDPEVSTFLCSECGYDLCERCWGDRTQEVCSECSKKLNGPKVPDVMVREMHFLDGILTIAANHPAFSSIASESAILLNELGGENYISFVMSHESVGRFEVTIRRSEGKTPAELVVELKKALRARDAKIEKLGMNAKFAVGFLRWMTDGNRVNECLALMKESEKLARGAQ